MAASFSSAIIANPQTTSQFNKINLMGARWTGFFLPSSEELVSTQRYFSKILFKQLPFYTNLLVYMTSGIAILSGRFMCFLLMLYCLLDTQMLNSELANYKKWPLYSYLIFPFSTYISFQLSQIFKPVAIKLQLKIGAQQKGFRIPGRLLMISSYIRSIRFQSQKNLA